MAGQHKKLIIIGWNRALHLWLTPAGQDAWTSQPASDVPNWLDCQPLRSAQALFGGQGSPAGFAVSV